MKRCPLCAAACLASHRHCPTCGADVSQVEVVAGDPYLGTTLAGKYHLTELIGAGAMGRVYRADHLALDAQVAVKLINPETATDAQTARRFQTEARAASRLRHPNTIQITDFGQAESGALFIVMELLRGRTLARIIEEGAVLSPRRIADLLGQALSALDEAHAAGVVHRDFKPENVFVEMLRTGREHVKVLDFGIAKLRGEADANLTLRGSVCGTPEYMSPEQIRGEELDARSDVYAAGVVLYECLTGRRPFETRGPAIDILTAHLQREPVPPRERRPELNIPRSLDLVCLKALTKNRDQRYRSAADMRKALEAAVRGLSGEQCAECGSPLPTAARFCHECGAVIRSSGTFTTVPEERRDERRDDTPLSARQLPTPPLPVIGRNDVLDRLDGLEREALLLVGEPGIGKSAVADTWVKRQAERSRTVVVARPDPSGAQLPLYPIRTALQGVLELGTRPLADRIESAVIDHPEDRTGLLELFGFGGAASALPLDVRRRECSAAALGTLRRSPVSLLFEDVHLYDGPSRRMLAQLIALPGEATVLATAEHPEAISVEVEVLRLTPLDDAAFNQLTELGLPPGLTDPTGGSPFAIEQWLRARLEGAADATVEERLQVLPPEARALLEAAAVAGADVPSHLLAQIVGISDPGRAINELAQRGWLKAVGLEKARSGGLEVASPTLRRRIYDGMSAERRKMLHVALAKQLSERGEDPIVVAHHAHLTGSAPSLMLERAGDAARDGFDDDASARWYRAALDRGRQALGDGKGDEGRQVRIALKLALVQRYRGDVLQSERVLREALELSRARSDTWAAIQALRGLARLASTWQQLDRAREHLIEAVGSALGGGDPGLLAELYLDLADVLVRLGEHASAERELWEGLMLCTGGDGPESARGPDQLWRILLLLGDLARRSGRLEVARSYGQQALKQSERAGGPLGRARAHAFLGAVHQTLGQQQRAAEHRRAAAEEMRRVGDRRSTAELLLAMADVNTVAREDARAWLKEADQLAQQLGWTEGIERSRQALMQLR